MFLARGLLLERSYMKHLLASLLLCTAALHGQSTSSKMSKDLDNIPALQMVEVVIQFDNKLFSD